MHDRRLADLMHVLDFTADDLAANRRGTLSERQREKLREGQSAQAGRLWLGVGLGYAAGVLTVFAAVTALSNTLSGAEAVESRIITGLLGVALLGAGTYFLRTATLGLAQRWAEQSAARARLADEAAAGVVKAASGALVYDTAQYLDDGRVDTFTIGGVSFAFEAERHSALLEGGAYTVYYTPGSRIIVSAEPDAGTASMS